MSGHTHVSPTTEELWAPHRADTFLIVGFTERTGRSVASALERFAVPYKVSDLRSRAELAPALAGLQAKEEDIFCGPQGAEQLAGVTKIILSPGVPRSIPLVAEAKRRGLPVLGDIDFLYRFVKHKKIVGITGTDGKTTTALLAGHLLEPLGRVVVAGNTGEAVFSRYDEILNCDLLVLELSSFMLEGVQHFRPDIAAITNIAEDHVERYVSFAAYRQAKLNLLAHCQAKDTFIKNLDDPALRLLRPQRLSVRTISQHDPSADYFHSGEKLRCRAETFAVEDCQLRGTHNRENILTAFAIACEVGIDPREAVARISTFPAVPHRFYYLGCHRGIHVYDDSKATTVHAVSRALESLPGQVVLVAGGRDKNLDFSPLRSHVAKIRKLVCYGEAGERIRTSVGLVGAGYVFDFEEAVLEAVAACQPGDTLLLSPGCTSWDQHADYAARGEMFREIVLRALAHAEGAASTGCGEPRKESGLRLVPPPGDALAVGEFPGIRFAQAERAGVESGRHTGDLWGVFPTEGEKLLLLFGELSGTGDLKRLGEAITGVARGVPSTSCAIILEQISTALFRRLRTQDATASLVVALLDVAKATFTYAVAGRLAPLLISELHAPFFLPGVGQPALGTDPYAIYRSTRVRLSAEARVILVTSGMTEARRGTKRFGNRAIRMAAANHAESDLGALPAALIGELEKFVGKEPLRSVRVLALQMEGSAEQALAANQSWRARLAQGVW